MFEAYVDAMRRSFDFDGRTSCADYWCHQLFAAVFCISALLLDGRPSETGEWGGGILFTLCLLVHIPAFLSSGARRLHDINKTGWLLLFSFVPGGAFYLLYQFVRRSDEGANRFGPSPWDVDTNLERELVSTLNGSDDVVLAGVEKLERLVRLRAEGVVDEEEYARMRARILEIIRR